MIKANQINGTTIQGVIFDLDGTLVDSKLNFDAIRGELGFPSDQPILEHLATLTSHQQIDNAHEVIRRHEMQGAEAATWMPGAEAFVLLMQQQGIPMAILTRNMQAATRLTLSSLNIPIELALTREDCKPKPDPEGLLYIAKQWQISCENIVYIGDYSFDVDAANNANMISCLYRNNHNSVFAKKANWVIEHFDELTEAFIDV
jgi:HAD superfamily hydrolase (TIGR01549 family)